MDNAFYCPNCMREIKDNSYAYCPYCGGEVQMENAARCLRINTVLNDKYLIGKVIGEGGFGITYIGYDLVLKNRIAVKEYFPTTLATRDTSVGIQTSLTVITGSDEELYKKGIERFVREAENLARFNQLPGIVSVRDFFYENNTAYMVMEYIDGITLKQYLEQKGGRIPYTEAISIIRPVMDSLQTVHQAGIIHRDISPDNIMVTFREQTGIQGSPSTINSMKLIDFGAARFVGNEDEKSLTVILKHGFAPVEQYQTNGNQGTWTDVYALSATIYKMATGITPQAAPDRLMSGDKVTPLHEIDSNITKQASSAIMHGMAVKLSERTQSIDELLHEINGKKRKKKNKVHVIVIAAAVVVLVAIASVSALLFTNARGSINGSVSSDNETTGDGESNEIDSQYDLSNINTDAPEWFRTYQAYFFDHYNVSGIQSYYIYFFDVRHTGEMDMLVADEEDDVFVIYRIDNEEVVPYYSKGYVDQGTEQGKELITQLDIVFIDEEAYLCMETHMPDASRQGDSDIWQDGIWTLSTFYLDDNGRELHSDVIYSENIKSTEDFYNRQNEHTRDMHRLDDEFYRQCMFGTHVMGSNADWNTLHWGYSAIRKDWNAWYNVLFSDEGWDKMLQCNEIAEGFAKLQGVDLIKLAVDDFTMDGYYEAVCVVPGTEEDYNLEQIIFLAVDDNNELAVTRIGMANEFRVLQWGSKKVFYSTLHGIGSFCEVKEDGTISSVPSPDGTAMVDDQNRVSVVKKYKEGELEDGFDEDGNPVEWKDFEVKIGIFEGARQSYAQYYYVYYADQWYEYDSLEIRIEDLERLNHAHDAINDGIEAIHSLIEDNILGGGPRINGEDAEGTAKIISCEPIQVLYSGNDMVYINYEIVIDYDMTYPEETNKTLTIYKNIVFNIINRELVFSHVGSGKRGLTSNNEIASNTQEYPY